MKYLPIVRYALMAMSALTMILFIVMGEQVVDLMLFWAYILFGMTLLTVVAMLLVGLIRNPRGTFRSLLPLMLIALVQGICTPLSSAAPVANPAGGWFIDPFALRLSDIYLYSAYIMLAAAIIVVIWGEVRNSFK
ncbi:hypothetical protein FACS1894159_11170 [Bacteroidia bacterium]|nr:hypothetical protein FACS1894159_11170 [Bacteroidia bacterium]